MTKLSLDVREQIVDMFQKGESHFNIARALNIGRSTIRKICLKFQKTWSMIDKKRSSLLKKLTDRETRSLCRTLKQDSFITARQITNESGINITAVIRTIHSYLSRYFQEELLSKKPSLVTAIWTDVFRYFVVQGLQQFGYCSVEKYYFLRWMPNRNHFVLSPVCQKSRSAYVWPEIHNEKYPIL